MFLVHKKGLGVGKKQVDGLVPYDFFCEDKPTINLFVFTGNGTAENAVKEQTLWGFTRLDRFEALSQTLHANRHKPGWFQTVNVLTGPAHNGSRSVKFQTVARIIRHGVAAAGKLRKAEYEIHTEEGDVYFTRSLSEPSELQTVIYTSDGQ
jgi:hypothetical protein